MATVYETIDLLCKQRNITHGKMCSDLGYSRNTMAALKNGRSTTLKLEKAQRIAEYFNVSVEYLLGNEKSLPEKSDKPSEEDIKLALFGGEGEVTDEMWEEAVFAVQLIKERHKRKQNDK